MKAVTNAPLYAAFYARIAEVCRGMGYALLVHGTLQNDLDVLAMPWVETPAPPEELITAVASLVEGTRARCLTGPTATERRSTCEFQSRSRMVVTCGRSY